jgi:hypothetical protein
VYAGGGFLEGLSYFQLLKKDAGAWSSFILRLGITFETLCYIR